MHEADADLAFVAGEILDPAPSKILALLGFGRDDQPLADKFGKFGRVRRPPLSSATKAVSARARRIQPHDLRDVRMTVPFPPPPEARTRSRTLRGRRSRRARSTSPSRTDHSPLPRAFLEGLIEQAVPDRRLHLEVRGDEIIGDICTGSFGSSSSLSRSITPPGVFSQWSSRSKSSLVVAKIGCAWANRRIAIGNDILAGEPNHRLVLFEDRVMGDLAVNSAPVRHARCARRGPKRVSSRPTTGPAARRSAAGC